MKTYLWLALTFFTISTSYSNDKTFIDDTIASGVVFKVSHIFGSLRENTGPNTVVEEMNTIRKDLDLLSKTERGQLLKKQGDELINAMIQVVTHDKKALEAMGLNANADVIELAKFLDNKITAYGKLANTPQWVYDPSKRKE